MERECRDALLVPGVDQDISRAGIIAEYPARYVFRLFQMALGPILFSVGARNLPSAQVALITTLEAPLSPLWVWL